MPRRTAALFEYQPCPVSGHEVSGFGPLLTLQRGDDDACIIYLYPAGFLRAPQALPLAVGGSGDGSRVPSLAAAAEGAFAELEALGTAPLAPRPLPFPPATLRVTPDVHRWPEVRMAQVRSRRSCGAAA